MRFIAATVVAKFIYTLLSITKGGGSTLPGLLAERIQPQYLSIIKRKLSAKIIIVSGTNGKTTTTKLITDSLSMLGHNVLSNSSGSNFTRGIISTFAVNYFKLKQYDYIVLEVDEAYAPVISEIFKPEIFVALNVFRDQLDRYGELDTTAGHLYRAAQFAKKVISNGEEKYFKSINKLQNAYIISASSKMLKLLPNDNNLYSNDDVIKTQNNIFLSFNSLDNGLIGYVYDDAKFTMPTYLDGVYNAYNVCFAVASLLLLGISASDANSAIQKVKPAFGRGETIVYKDRKIKLFLSKNPAGFNHIIEQLKTDEYRKADIAILINDKIADGKDISWLWDVAFEQLDSSVKYHISGSRRLDMALRLKIIRKQYIIHESIEQLLKITDQDDVVFVTTYTAMNEIRQYLRDSGVKIGALS